MKPQPSKWIRLALPGAAGLVLVQSLHAATVLTGEGAPHNEALPVDHGSNAPGTPDVALNWFSVGGTGWQAYEGWPNADGIGVDGWAYQLDGSPGDYDGSETYSITFTPSSATIAVILTSVDLNDWVGPSNPARATTILDWSVTGSVSGFLAGETGVSAVNGGVVSLPLNVQGLAGEALTLSFVPTAGAPSYFAIDNLSFDQVTVPEPSGAILAAAGLGAMAMRRRRK